MIDETYVLKSQCTIDKKFNPNYGSQTESKPAKKPSNPNKSSQAKRELNNWEKPPNMVAKRNARERTRVHTVNQAFVILKHRLPALKSHTKRVSKLKILRAAITYIENMINLLKSSDVQPVLTPAVLPPFTKRPSTKVVATTSSQSKSTPVIPLADQSLVATTGPTSAATYIKPFLEYPAYIYQAQAQAQVQAQAQAQAQAYSYTTTSTSQLATATSYVPPTHAIFVGNGFIIPQGY